jgi:hypothetical protein
MELILTLALVGLLGWLIYTMAEKRNRNAWAWTILSCLIFPIGGIALLLLLGTLPENKKEEV